MPFDKHGNNCIIILVLCISGLIANLFVVSSILFQMRLEGSIQTANILMACNSLNNLALVFFIFAIFLALNLNVCPTEGIITGLIFAWEMSTVMQMWGITLICTFYCLKIVPGRGRLSLWLRRNFSLVVAVLVMVGLTFALVLSYIDLNRETATNVTDVIKKRLNTTCPYSKLYDWLVPIKMAILSLLHISVFFLMTYSCATLVVHLYSHVKRMRGNQPHMGGAKQQGVTSVAIMIFLLAMEFGSCTIAREWLLVGAAEIMSIPFISDVSTLSLALCSLIPITLIAGTSSLRESATSCCSKA